MGRGVGDLPAPFHEETVSRIEKPISVVSMAACGSSR